MSNIPELQKFIQEESAKINTHQGFINDTIQDLNKIKDVIDALYMKINVAQSANEDDTKLREALMEHKSAHATIIKHLTGYKAQFKSTLESLIAMRKHVQEVQALEQSIAKDQEEIAQLKAHLKQQEEQIATTQQELKEVEEQAGEQQQVDDFEKSIEALTKQLNIDEEMQQLEELDHDKKENKKA